MNLTSMRHQKKRCGCAGWTFSERGKTGCFSKTISFSCSDSNNKSCKVEVTSKGVNLGHGNDLQITCILYLTGHANFINKLKEILLP